LDLLRQRQSIPVIWIIDAAPTRQRKIWDAVINHMLEGATVVLTGFFSTMTNSGEFDRFFARLGLPWERGAYHRATIPLNGNAVDQQLARHLPSSCSVKAVYLNNVDSSAVWYADERDQTAVAFAQVGKGRIGYIGDANLERESQTIALAMSGILD
jgi:hypothetical protein